MDVLGDLVARERRGKDPLVYATGQPYTAHKFCTDAWKAANLFRYHGVGPGRPVAVADDPRPQALLAFFGAALLGSSVRFGFPPAEDARLVVGPVETVAALPDEPGRKRAAYADQPADPDVIHFERDLWSENPTVPPDTVDPEDPVVESDDASYSHADLLRAAEDVLASAGLSADDEVAIRASLTRPGTVVAGVVAPLSVGATLLLPGADRTGAVAVAEETAPEGTVVRPSDVPVAD